MPPCGKISQTQKNIIKTENRDKKIQKFSDSLHVNATKEPIKVVRLQKNKKYRNKKINPQQPKNIENQSKKVVRKNQQKVA